MEKAEENGKLQTMIEKWGVKSAALLLVLVVFVYQQDRAQHMADNKALSARTAANERAIGRLQEGKASREELKAAMDSISKDNQRSRDDIKEIVSTLRSDLIQRMDLLTNRK